MENFMYFKRSANFFEEALPIGNGRIGAMVYGRCDTEKISLNEDTLWTGTRDKLFVPENGPEIFARLRELVNNGDDKTAVEVANRDFLSDNIDSYLPLGNLFLEFGHSAENYERRLDFATGITSVEYKSNGVNYYRQAFVSREHNCFALKISADKSGSVSFRVKLDNVLKITNTDINNNTIIYDGVCPYKAEGFFTDEHSFVYDESKETLTFTAGYRVDCVGGKTAFADGGISVENADEAVIYLCVETAFDGIDKPYKEHHLLCVDRLSLCNDFNYIKELHIKDYSNLYNRAQLSLGGENNKRSTEERLINFDKNDNGMYELLFNYGRYLTIASSREGTQATNLQGIWNEHLAPPWRSDYTVNINTEMNYWPTLPTNLSECYGPFVDLMKKLRITGRETAKDFYAAKGFVCHHNSDLWGHSNPVAKGQPSGWIFATWNMSTGWIACQLFDLYEYTMDKAILRNEIYPLMKEAAEFYLDILVRDKDGKYMISPSSSPENVFKNERGELSSLSRTTTMTASILYELFNKLVTACNILKCDEEFKNKLEEIIPELYTPQIASDGRLKEWYEEREEEDKLHRHVSHLYGLYPGDSINQNTTDLFEACKKSLLGRGDDGTGWSLGWKVALWARLKDGNHALKILQRQLQYVEATAQVNYSFGGGTYLNLFDAHPPFQIDGNFGSSAGILEMLLQSRMGEIEILPALPDAFNKGYFKNMKAKGNVTVSVWWNNGKPEKIVLSSPIKQNITLKYDGKTEHYELDGEITVLN